MSKPSPKKEIKKRKVIFVACRITAETDDFLKEVAERAGTSKSGAIRGLVNGVREVLLRRASESRQKKEGPGGP